MADFGAEVIKLESLEGDPLRQLAQGPTSPPCDHNYFWVLDGRNKRSIALDLKDPAAAPVRDALLRWADVLVTNFRPDLAERLSLDWARVKTLNSKLIYAHITGYGDLGPVSPATTPRPGGHAPGSPIGSAFPGPGLPCRRRAWAIMRRRWRFTVPS